MPFDLNQPDFGYMGECYIQFELSKRGIRTVPLPSFGFEYDLLASNGARIEVKSANLRLNATGQESWAFTNKSCSISYSGENKMFIRNQFKRDRQCDIFVFVCFIDDTANRAYIAPKSVMGTKYAITLFRNPIRSKWDCWKDRWDLIERFGKPDEIAPYSFNPKKRLDTQETLESQSQNTRLDGP